MHVYLDSMIEDDTEIIPMYNDMESCVVKAVTAEGIGECRLCITVVDEAEIARLNRDFRDKDAVTDVLSFPANDIKISLADAIKGGYSPEIEEGEIYLGDIAICFERATSQALEYGNSLTEEMCFLAVHGCLHLLGYDHMNEEDERVMRLKQRTALGRTK